MRALRRASQSLGKGVTRLIAGLQVFQQYGQSGYAASPTQYKSQNYGASGSGQGWYEASTHAQPTFILK